MCEAAAGWVYCAAESAEQLLYYSAVSVASDLLQQQIASLPVKRFAGVPVHYRSQ